MVVGGGDTGEEGARERRAAGVGERSGEGRLKEDGENKKKEEKRGVEQEAWTNAGPDLEGERMRGKSMVEEGGEMRLEEGERGESEL